MWLIEERADSAFIERGRGQAAGSVFSLAIIVPAALLISLAPGGSAQTRRHVAWFQIDASNRADVRD